jgi:hypothetical protein
MSGSRPPLVVSILQIISLPAIPLGILVALIGLLIFLGTSSVARWGVALAAWGKILPAIAVAAVLSSAAPFALAAVGMAGGTMLADLSQLATGFLWVALGVALWRHAPENQNVGTTPLTS